MAKLKPFKELTLKGQKMRIVRDAIAQINTKLFKPKNGVYLDFDNSYGYKDSLKTLFLNRQECTCCAKGAIFSACVLNVNKVYGKDDFSDNEFQKNKLKKWFEEKELNLIECAFELCVVGLENTSATLVKTRVTESRNLGNMEYCKTWLEDNKEYLLPETIKAIKFGRKYKNSTNRLLAILNNILKNGEFKP